MKVVASDRIWNAREEADIPIWKVRWLWTDEEG